MCRQGGFTLTLFKAKGDEKAEPPGTRPCMSTDLLVDDLDEAVARVEACGGTVAPVRDWEEGRFTLFRDPDGISVKAIVDAVREPQSTDLFPEGRWPPQVAEVDARMETAMQNSIGTHSLYDLLGEAQTGGAAEGD